MNDTVREWIAKAEADWATARREMAVQGEPNYDAVCFHAQQAIEKLLKAALIHHRTTPPRTHDLPELSRLLTQARPTWSWSVGDLGFVSRAAVVFRYPGESAEQEDAAEALRLAAPLRDALVKLLA
jgi:HEPN domain-containing protein